MSNSDLKPSSAPSQRGHETRERILISATELFARRSFAPVTMRAIGDAAGLDNSSLYRHFRSKSALAREVLHRAMAGLAADVTPRTSTTPATSDGIVDLLTVAALHLWDHPDTARLVLHWVTTASDSATSFDVSLPIDAVGAPSGDIYRGVVALLGRAQAAGEIRQVAWPEAFVAVVGALALRPATYRSLLTSQEPERSDVEARLSWEREVRVLLRGMLAA